MAVLTASVVATLAYLMGTDSAVNTFTMGQVHISVDEAKVNADGTPIAGADRVKANEYHILPGMEYTKDPTVTVNGGSEDAYVRMILTVYNSSDVQAILTKYNLGDFSVLIGGWDKNTWLYEGFTEDTEKNTISFEFRYKEIAAKNADDTKLPALFDTLIVPGEITGEEMKDLYDGGFKIEVFGHAIQAAGFDTADIAWTAFDSQYNP
jgi:archaellum component FlaF (FlaF/FlaG flagellin family)